MGRETTSVPISVSPPPISLTSAPNYFAFTSTEPYPPNIDRLRNNLRQFEGDYALHAIAVGEAGGEAEFGWEDTGRYGGIGIETASTYVSLARILTNL